MGLLDLVPGRVLAGVRSVAVVGCVLGVVWVAVRLEQHGADRIQRKWDAAELARTLAEGELRREDARFGGQASESHEADRRAMQGVVDRQRRALDAALKRPSKCGATAGDVVIPGDLGVQLNAIRQAGAAGSAASEFAD